MGTWYVSAGRFTIFERNANNAVEMYRYEKQSQTIDIDFSYRKGSPSGKEKRFPQKGKVVEGSQNAHWKVSPFWPLKFDYLIIALAEDYSWVAVGVPNQKYLWIMHRKKEATRKEITDILDHVKAIGYNVQDIEYVPQKWN
jgi:apolipoprotein D and lipocalin family protein